MQKSAPEVIDEIGTIGLKLTQETSVDRLLVLGISKEGLSISSNICCNRHLRLALLTSALMIEDNDEPISKHLVDLTEH